MSKPGTCLLIVFILTLAQWVVIYSYPSRTQALTSMQLFHMLISIMQFWAVILAWATLE